LLIREIDPKAVDVLKEKIIQHLNRFYSRIPVIALQLKSKDESKKEYLSSLCLETLGNNHLRKASQELVIDQHFRGCQIVLNHDVMIYAGRAHYWSRMSIVYRFSLAQVGAWLGFVARILPTL